MKKIREIHNLPNFASDIKVNLSDRITLFRYPLKLSENHPLLYGNVRSSLKYPTFLNCFSVWLRGERRLTLFPARTIIRDPHHRKCPTRREQELNMRKS